MEDNTTGVTACYDKEETQQKTNVDFKFNKHIFKPKTEERDNARWKRWRVSKPPYVNDDVDVWEGK